MRKCRSLYNSMFLRSFFFYYLYLKLKITQRRYISFRGFSVIYSDKNSSILFEKNAQSKIRFFSHKFSNLLGICQKCFVVAVKGGKIEIGFGTGVSGSSIYSMSSISIGRNVLIGTGCKIIDNDFHPLQASKRNPQKQEDIKKKPISIGDGCFIGANSIILKGTTLGRNCVVGAGSVVSGTFPDNVVIAGNPARIIKSNEK